MATGDVIVFLDYYVKPRAGWERAMLRAMAGNYRRVVVPVITALDYRDWVERGNLAARAYFRKSH